jgi:hypothetical protein
MKRSLTYTVSTALVLAFLMVTTLAMVCAYHHGIDGLDQRPQSGSHTTLFCPTFSKVSGLALMITSGLNDYRLKELKAELFQSSLLFLSSFVQDHLARSPPTTLLS